jgi:hypothetical protein
MRPLVRAHRMGHPAECEIGSIAVMAGCILKASAAIHTFCTYCLESEEWDALPNAPGGAVAASRSAPPTAVKTE